MIPHPKGGMFQGQYTHSTSWECKSKQQTIFFHLIDEQIF